MIYARQSTAIIVTVGPVLDADGVAVTDGVVGDFKISKNGGAPAALNGSATLTHRNTGHYSLSLTATDVNTVGTVEIVIDDTTNACPMKEIQVVEEATYDVLFAASAAGPASPTNITAGTITTATNVTTVNGLAANVITAASMAADASAEIADAVWDEDATAHQTQGTFGQAIGDPGADTNTIFKAVVTDATGATVGVDAAAILADTGTDGVVVASLAANSITAAAAAADFGTEIGTAVWATGTRVLTANTNLGIGTPTDLGSGATLAANLVDIEAQTDDIGAAGAGLTALASAADLATVDTVVDGIKAKTDSLNFTVAGVVDSNIQRVNDVAITGDGSGTPFNV